MCAVSRACRKHSHLPPHNPATCNTVHTTLSVTYNSVLPTTMWMHVPGAGAPDTTAHASAVAECDRNDATRAPHSVSPMSSGSTGWESPGWQPAVPPALTAHALALGGQSVCIGQFPDAFPDRTPLRRPRHRCRSTSRRRASSDDSTMLNNELDAPSPTHSTPPMHDEDPKVYTGTATHTVPHTVCVLDTAPTSRAVTPDATPQRTSPPLGPSRSRSPGPSRVAVRAPHTSPQDKKETQESRPCSAVITQCSVVHWVLSWVRCRVRGRTQR